MCWYIHAKTVKQCIFFAAICIACILYLIDSRMTADRTLYVLPCVIMSYSAMTSGDCTAKSIRYCKIRALCCQTVTCQYVCILYTRYTCT